MKYMCMHDLNIDGALMSKSHFARTQFCLIAFFNVPEFSKRFKVNGLKCEGSAITCVFFNHAFIILNIINIYFLSG